MFSSNTSAVSDSATFVEDVFNTYAYNGTGSSRAINNGIDLAGEGGLVWIKRRNENRDHLLYDSTRLLRPLVSNSTTAPYSSVTNGVTAFNSNGFSLGNLVEANASTGTYAAWTFRKQPKFFDCVAWNGTGANRTIAHNLESVPGCIIVKRTDTTSNWQVYHRSLANSQYMVLNTRDPVASGSTRWNSTTPTSTVFSLGTDATVNASGGTYVAYVFAHNAGGFGLAGTDNVISCGVYAGNGLASGQVINLGFEPQWVMIKRTTDVGAGWEMFDVMRSMSETDSSSFEANDIGTGTNYNTATIVPVATGIKVLTGNLAFNGSGYNYIYIAIRRGGMKAPTTSTSVFAPTAATAAGGTFQTTGFPIDAQFSTYRLGAGSWVNDRLRGISATSSGSPTGPIWVTTGTAAESITAGTRTAVWDSTRFTVGANANNIEMIWWSFRRATSFMDVVCYTGTGGSASMPHNLGVAPEFWIFKRRNGTGGSFVGSSVIANTEYLQLNTVNQKITSTSAWNSTYPTASVFTTGSSVNTSGETYVAYFFASCPGVSKVGSYTGTGTTQTIDCGFTAGSRFVLIKATSTTGDWLVWDSARGIVAGNDPYITLNTTAAEVTNKDYLDTAATGFELSNAAGNLANTNGVSYIFLAIA